MLDRLGRYQAAALARTDDETHAWIDRPDFEEPLSHSSSSVLLPRAAASHLRATPSKPPLKPRRMEPRGRVLEMSGISGISGDSGVCSRPIHIGATISRGHWCGLARP